jgi:hypothetical protein
MPTLLKRVGNPPPPPRRPTPLCTQLVLRRAGLTIEAHWFRWLCPPQQAPPWLPVLTWALRAVGLLRLWGHRTLGCATCLPCASLQALSACWWGLFKWGRVSFFPLLLSGMLGGLNVWEEHRESRHQPRLLHPLISCAELKAKGTRGSGRSGTAPPGPEGYQAGPTGATWWAAQMTKTLMG